MGKNKKKLPAHTANNNQEKPKIGRPTDYTHELGEEIKQLLAEGHSIRSIGETEGMPTWRCLMNWAGDPKHPFFQQYALGRMLQADTYADQIVSIADTAQTKDDSYAKRLQVDARKWVAAKLKPQQYGERIAQVLDVIASQRNEKGDVVPAMTKSQALELLAQRKGKKDA